MPQAHMFSDIHYAYTFFCLYNDLEIVKNIFVYEYSGYYIHICIPRKRK